MDKQEYLNQIAATNRPAKQPTKGIFASKFLWVGIAGVAALILIILIGSVIGGAKGGISQKVFALQLHLENTSEVIQTYQPNVKSSVLRSSSASLYSVLSDTNRKMTDYIAEHYADKASEKLVEEATLEKDGLAADLFEAKINGILDRIYAHKMAYEISLFMTEETQIYDATGDENLKEMMTASRNSLNTLYDQFNNFSEAK